MDLEEEKVRSQRLEKNSPEEAEWETKRVVDDYKFKLQKSEQDINTLQTTVSEICLHFSFSHPLFRPFLKAEKLKRSLKDLIVRLLLKFAFPLSKQTKHPVNTFQVARLESQVVRFQTAAETAERSEEELKTERRKLQREVNNFHKILRLSYVVVYIFNGNVDVIPF